MSIRAWLEAAGLAEYAPRFAVLSDNEFKSLLMADYGKFGVSDLGHKQRLYQLLKDLNQMEQHSFPVRAAQHSYQPHHMSGADGLLDLDEHDSDLLVPTGGPAFQISPMNEPRYQAPQQQQQQQSDGIPITEEPPKIKVVVRKRPINRKERERQEDDIVDTNSERHFVIVNEPKVKVDLTKYVERHQFNFDEVLDDQVPNDIVYRKTVQPLVHTLFRNGKASCFAYGQTGSGKTFTMSPLPIRAAGDIFKYLALPDLRDINLHVSCFEIYGNKCFDLLNQRKKLNILEDGKRNVVVVGLKEFIVDTVDTVKELIEEANDRRSTGSTAANSDSSRSHSIMQFALKRTMPDNSGYKLVGKISFIDLAGSERGADTFDNNRQTRMEGAEINKSLLALKECIRALDSDARHVPFRGSKLTAVLKDSFIGAEARTVMIANISPVGTSVEHTLNTLRYADRVKELRKDKGERTAGGVTPGSEDYYAAVNRVEEPAPKPMVAPAPPGMAAPEDRRRMAAPVPAPAPAPLAPSANPTFARPAAASPHKPEYLGRPHSFKGSAVQQDSSEQRSNNMIPASYGVHEPQAPPPQQHQRGSSAATSSSTVPSSSAVPSFEDEDELLNARNELMESIMEDEETLINSHRVQIERTMDIVRQEMNLLTEVDQPGSAIDQYVERLEVILREKADGIAMMQRKLEDFKSKLKEEEIMSRTVGSRGRTKARY